LIGPFRPIVHDHINLEVARGCTRGCRFCQAGMIYRPVRERSISRLKELADNLLKTTGWEELSLLSLSTGDYTEIVKLLEHLVAKYFSDNITISFPSLRAETIRSPWLSVLNGGRKTGFTIAPEAGTERLRRVINKNLTEKEIIETSAQVFASGCKSIKLYFMIGLPTETQNDLEKIIVLANQVFDQGKKTIRHPEVTISVSTFVPKPHTPFQWLAMLSLDEIKFRQAYLRQNLKNKRINFKWQDPEMSILEGIMARGDRRLAPVITEAFANGARFDGWTDLFNFSIWEKALKKYDLDPDFFLGLKKEMDILPWDMIDAGVTKDFLWREYCDSLQEKEILDCRSESCNQCGVCDFKSVYPRVQHYRGSFT
ncbi:MAG: radical SAM protein, partial [Desulfobacterota bacterium]|nr:radical SAM protein [Thermodesulfobacteriota bacterium]